VDSNNESTRTMERPARANERTKRSSTAPRTGKGERLFCFCFGSADSANCRMIIVGGRTFEIAIERAIQVARLGGISPTGGLRWLDVDTRNVPPAFVGRVLDHRAVQTLDATLGRWVH
jgi:hypothetical protein